MKSAIQIVLDTNVLVSGLMKKNSVPAIVVDMILERKIKLALDSRIMEEYSEVTSRPRLHIQEFVREAALSFIAVYGIYVSPLPLNLSPDQIPDLKDLPFAEAAVSAKANALVTGNGRHFMFLNEFQVQVMSPAQFVHWMDEK